MRERFDDFAVDLFSGSSNILYIHNICILEVFVLVLVLILVMCIKKGSF